LYHRCGDSMDSDTLCLYTACKCFEYIRK